MESNTGRKLTWWVTKRTVLFDRALMTYSCYKELCKTVANQIVMQYASADMILTLKRLVVVWASTSMKGSSRRYMSAF